MPTGGRYPDRSGSNNANYRHGQWQRIDQNCAACGASFHGPRRRKYCSPACVATGMKGHGFSAETLERMRQAKLGKPQTEEHRRNNAKAQLGKKRTDEARARMSTVQKGRVKSTEHRLKLSAARKGVSRSAPPTEATRQKLSKSVKAAYENGLREKRRSWAKARWQDPERARAWATSMFRKPSGPERRAAARLGDQWRYTGNGVFWIEGMNPDFMHITEPRVIEIFGRYWHRNDNPQDRIDRFAAAGYECQVIWEDQIEELIPVQVSF